MSLSSLLVISYLSFSLSISLSSSFSFSFVFSLSLTLFLILYISLSFSFSTLNSLSHSLHFTLFLILYIELSFSFSLSLLFSLPLFLLSQSFSVLSPDTKWSSTFSLWLYPFLPWSIIEGGIKLGPRSWADSKKPLRLFLSDAAAADLWN